MRPPAFLTPFLYLRDSDFLSNDEVAEANAACSSRSGYNVFTICSPRNFGYVKELGAVAAFDYRDPASVQKLKTEAQGLKLAWDTVSTADSAEFCMQTLDKGPNVKYGCVSFPAVEISRSDISNIGILMYSVFGQAVEKKGIKFQASSEDFEFTKEFMALTESLLASGQLRPHTEDVGQGGLEGVLDGLKRLEKGEVSGKKLVYRVSETS